MANTQHYLWAAGHFSLLLFSLRYFLAYVTFKSTLYVKSYRFALLGALVSYAIVCFKALGPPFPSSAFVNKALLDENVQYFLLALYWWFSKPIPVALLPYTVFSLFHALTFIRTTILPKLYSPSPAQGSGSPVPQQTQIGKMIQVWVKSNYDRAMYLTAFAEFFIFFRVIFGALTFQNSFLTPILYAHFVRQRYYQSLFTRYAAGEVRKRIDQYAAMHPTAHQVWESSKRAIAAWVGNTLEPASPAGSSGRAPTPRS